MTTLKSSGMAFQTTGESKEGLNKNVLDGKRTESRNEHFGRTRNSQFWTEFGQKTGKWPKDRRKNRQIRSSYVKKVVIALNVGVIFL